MNEPQPHKDYATLEDLIYTSGKAELVDGRIVSMAPTGGAPGYAGDEIFVSLRAYARRVQRGIAVGDNKGFRVNLPHRQSFSPDGMSFLCRCSCICCRAGTKTGRLFCGWDAGRMGCRFAQR